VRLRGEVEVEGEVEGAWGFPTEAPRWPRQSVDGRCLVRARLRARLRVRLRVRLWVRVRRARVRVRLG